MLDALKARIGRMRLRDELAALQRSKAFYGIDEIKTVGISVLFTTAEDFELLRKYVNYLRDLKKKVKVLVHYTGKEEPAVQYSKLEYDFYSRKTLDWTGRPSGHIVQNFMDEPFDMLLDLNDGNSFALYCVGGLSKASFKIGRFEEDGEHLHDMLIDSPAEKGLKYYLRQIDTYLQLINSPAAQ
ncbi:MAG: hypothetical protein MUC87_17530 [Bacteroidia bacterium]|jgi:hypothetical protein|nr:hypothetical protein [Bacteroidia bacterium]